MYSFPNGFVERPILGQNHFTVGARPPICSEGNLIGFGDIDVRDGGGVVRTFRNQLIFEAMTRRGDSGSIVCYNDKIVGLVFAIVDDSNGSPLETICNKLYTSGLKIIGSIELNGRGRLPVVDDTEALVATGAGVATGTEAALLKSLRDDRDSPAFLAQPRYFLGEAVKVKRAHLADVWGYTDTALTYRSLGTSVRVQGRACQ